MRRLRLGLLVSLLGLAACSNPTNEEPYVDAGPPVTCDTENVLDGSFAFSVTQGAECFAPLPDGGPDYGAVTLQLAAQGIACEPTGASPLPVCSGAGEGDEIYLQYGTPGNPEAQPLAVGTWNVANVNGAPWITVFFTDNLTAPVNAQAGQIVISALTPTQIAGSLQGLTFTLPDGGLATLSGPFCTSFCGVLTEGG